LFHPVFGHFLDDLSSKLPTPPEIVEATVDYMRATSENYEIGMRQFYLEPCIRRIFARNRLALDGTMFFVIRFEETLQPMRALFRSDRNELGARGGDPGTEAGLKVVQCWAVDEVDEYHLSLSRLRNDAFFAISWQECARSPAAQGSYSQQLGLGSVSSELSLRTNGSSSALQISFGLASMPRQRTVVIIGLLTSCIR
jgi:hypothetical protein